MDGRITLFYFNFFFFSNVVFREVKVCLVVCVCQQREGLSGAPLIQQCNKCNVEANVVARGEQLGAPHAVEKSFAFYRQMSKYFILKFHGSCGYFSVKLTQSRFLTSTTSKTTTRHARDLQPAGSLSHKGKGRRDGVSGVSGVSCPKQRAARDLQLSLLRSVLSVV